MRTKDLFYWINERHSIWESKHKGRQKPWTDDKILQQYRFCNVYRELDKETLWIAKNWRNPHATDPDLWFAMVVARLVNWSPTLAMLGYPVPWKRERFVGTLHAMKNAGKKAFGGAYIVSTNGNAMDKAEYLADYVLSHLWGEREYVRPTKADTLRSFFDRLAEFNGMGSFMAGQVVADAKYVAPLLNAPDWHTFAVSGPGSRRGLNRVFGRPVDAPWTEKNWYDHLLYLKKEIDPLVAAAKLPPIHAQDLQNCLCEFDKMERVRLGEGKPRARYPGA